MCDQFGCFITFNFAELLDKQHVFQLGMWKRSIFMPLPPLPLPLSLPLPFYNSNTSSYPILQIGSGQSLPHP